MITISNISKTDDIIYMQMKEGSALLCEATAQIKNGVAYLMDIREYKSGFAFAMGKALLNAIDLRGIEKVICNNINLHEILKRLRFKEENCAFSLLLEGYFLTNCETL